jgi:CRP/FNR family cyclic AMP-dependent transcriptional regulator
VDKKVFLVAGADEKQVKGLSDTLRATYEGCTIYSALDGSEALIKMRNVTPHVLITDIELPKFSGSELIRTVMKEFPGTGVLVISEIPDQEVFVDEVVRGRLQFVARPVDDKKIFLDSVNRALGRASSQKDPEFRMRFLSPGEILFRQGDKADSAFLVKKGKLRAFRKLAMGSQTLGEILAGEFVGEMAHINGEPRSADVEALDNSELIEIPLGTLDVLLFSKPAWSKALMKTLSRRLKAANK